MNKTIVKAKVLKLFLCLFICVLLIFLDQLTKNWAVDHLRLSDDIVIIKGVFQLHYLENQGMAFGLLQKQQGLFALMTFIIMAAAFYALYKTPENRRFFWMHLILVLLISGAIGNFIDRFSQKYVVDFLYFSLIDFPVFNVADCYVSAAGLLAVIFVLFFYKEDELGSIYRIGRKKKEETKE